MEDLVRRQEFLERRLRESSDPAERIGDLIVLRLCLRLVGEILEAAAAAGPKVMARRSAAQRAGLQAFGDERLCVAPLHLRNACANRVAGQAASHKDDEPV